MKIGDIFRSGGRLFQILDIKEDSFFAEETPRPRYTVVKHQKFDNADFPGALPGFQPPTSTEAYLRQDEAGYWTWYNGHQADENHSRLRLDFGLALMGEWVSTANLHRTRYEATIQDVINQAFGSPRDNRWGPDILIRGLGLDPLMTLAELRRILNEDMS